jgi:hypothetical protein
VVWERGVGAQSNHYTSLVGMMQKTFEVSDRKLILSAAGSTGWAETPAEVSP